MRKKLLSPALLSLALALSLTACSNNDAATSAKEQPSTTQTTENSAPTESAESTEEPATEETESSPSATDDLGSLLVMENHTDLTQVEGAIMFSTTESLDAIKAFYGDVIASLDANGQETEGPLADLQTWTWSGTYSGGTLDITAVESGDGGGFGIAISYT